MNKTGTIGISKDDVIWFRHIMNVAIFKIGSIQFQPFEMVYLDKETIGEDYMTFNKEWKKSLPTGTPVINCHIQQGADLSFETVEKSFQSAEEFFLTFFPSVRYRAFLCYSWLLYPPMVMNLSSNSNIKQFASKFSIIGTCNDSKQAIEYLFENEEKESLVDMTTLQKMAREHQDSLGFACGIILT